MKSDVVPVDKVLPENAEEETCVRYSPSQQWYYLSEQKPEEILLFVQWEDNDQWSEGSSMFLAAVRAFCKFPMTDSRP
jgi:quinol monooxygenase YgiN